MFHGRLPTPVTEGGMESTRAADRARRLMLVDDHPVFRQGLAQLLDREPDLVVVAQAADHVSAMRTLRQTQVDLFVADLTLGGTSGLSLVKSVVAEWPALPILVLSMHDERAYGERAFRAGAQGYVMKDQPWDVVLRSVRAVLAGQLAFSGAVARSVLSSRDGGAGAAALSDRELEVFELIGKGLRVREVGARLHVSPKTVESHIASIKRKLGIQHVNELVHRATLWQLARSQDGPAGA